MVAIRKPKNAIKLSRPSQWWSGIWREALPTGNGVIGASVYGGAGSDTIMITHAGLWWQGHTGVLQDVADKLPSVRKSLDSGNYREGENILQNALMQKGYRPLISCPLPVCDLRVNQPLDKSVKEYSRVLNMENGEISVSFRDSVSKYDRSVFVSRVQDLVCYEITKTGNKTINVDFALEMHDKFYARTPQSISKLPESVTSKYEDYFMYFAARSDNGTDFGAVAKILYYGGKQVVHPTKGISVRDTDRVLVILKPFIESSREKEFKALKNTLSAVKLTYDKLIKEHTAVHSKLFLSSELDLEAEDRDEFADELVKKAQLTGDVPLALVEKLWGLGRFLMITSTLPSSRPMAPYGIWSGDYKASASQITVDSLINQYSHALSGNLSEYMQSVFAYYEAHMDDLKKNASRLYGCRGVFVPHVMGSGTGLIGSVESSVIHNISCSGQIARLFFDYYLYTDDKKFLKERAMPFMREVALFFEEFFKVGTGGLYESSPSYSNNTTPLGFDTNGEPLQIAKNSLIDFATVKELLNNLIYASNVTNLYKTEVSKWTDMLKKIPAYQIGDDNTVKEYCDNKLMDNHASPSTTVFYPMYPSIEITKDKSSSSDILKSFLNTAKKRVVASIASTTSTDLMRMSNVFCRLGEGQNAFEQLSNVVKNMTMQNLIIAKNDWRGMGIGINDMWATYTTESNSLATSSIQEMLLQSTMDSITVLPALPSDFGRGEVQGLVARMGLECDIAWDSKKGLITLKVKSKKAGKTTIYFPDTVKRVKGNGSEKVDILAHKLDIELPASKVVVVEMRG